jgi:hypothetical protein
LFLIDAAVAVTVFPKQFEGIEFGICQVAEQGEEVH